MSRLAAVAFDPSIDTNHAQPVDIRLVEMLYRGDPGWFLTSLEGFLFFYCHHLQETFMGPAQPALKFKIMCSIDGMPLVYRSIYARWAKTDEIAKIFIPTLMRKNAKSISLQPDLSRALKVGRIALSRGVDIASIKILMIKAFSRGPDGGDPNLPQVWDAACQNTSSNANSALLSPISTILSDPELIDLEATESPSPLARFAAHFPPTPHSSRTNIEHTKTQHPLGTFNCLINETLDDTLDEVSSMDDEILTLEDLDEQAWLLQSEHQQNLHDEYFYFARTYSGDPIFSINRAAERLLFNPISVPVSA